MSSSFTVLAGPEADHAAGREPAAFDQALEHALAVGVHAHGLGADDLVLQDRGERPGQVPGLEERAPVDVLGQLGQVEVLEHAAADELGHRRRVAGPVDRRLVGARLGQRPQRHLLLVGVLVAHLVVVGVELVDVLARPGRTAGLRHAHAARGIGHVDHRAFVVRRDLHGRVHAAGGGAADHQRDLLDAEVVVLLHLAGHVLHLFQARRDQAGQADDVGALDLGARQDLVARAPSRPCSPPRSCCTGARR